MDKQLPLNLNPSNILQHPIIGSVLESSNILLRIKRKRKKISTFSINDDNPWSDPEFSVEGIIENVCRFRALSDYQVIVNKSDPICALVHAMNTLDGII